MANVRLPSAWNGKPHKALLAAKEEDRFTADTPEGVIISILSHPHQPNHLPNIFHLLQMPQAVQESVVQVGARPVPGLLSLRPETRLPEAAKPVCM